MTIGFISIAAASGRCHYCVKTNTTLRSFALAEHILFSKLGKFTVKCHTANAEYLNLSAVLAKLSFMFQNTNFKAEKIYHGQTEIQNSNVKRRK